MTAVDAGDPVLPGVDTVSIRIDGATVRARGVVTGSTVDLLLAALDFLAGTTPQVTLDLTSAATVDVVAAQALLMAHYDALAAGSSLHLVIPSHLRRRLTVCHAMTTPSGRRPWRTARPPR